MLIIKVDVYQFCFQRFICFDECNSKRLSLSDHLNFAVRVKHLKYEEGISNGAQATVGARYKYNV